MTIKGKRIRHTEMVRTDDLIVAVEFELVIPADDPSEPCYEPQTLRLLDEVQQHAERGDVAWLQRHGKVYQALQGAAGAA